MKITTLEKKEVDVFYLKAECSVRYWEDAIVNDTEDAAGDLIPCREGNLWCPVIELSTGVVINWEEGKEADVHYKICDAGIYTLFDKNKNQLKSIDGYVPEIMCPEDKGYGDYVIMKIDKSGKIKNWKVVLSEFESELND